MKNYLLLGQHLALCCIIAIIVGNWGNTETTLDGDKKQQVNFYGSLLTHQTQKSINIDNISVGGKYKQISMVEKPTISAKSDTENTKTQKNGHQEIQLDVDPKTDLVTTKIDLNEVSELQIPNPHTIWTYQKESTYRKIEFLEVIIISNDAQKTKSRYLLEARTKIYCNEINDAGPIHKEVPLGAINILKIDGYKFRTITTDPKTDTTSCGCEPVKSCNTSKTATTP